MFEQREDRRISIVGGLILAALTLYPVLPSMS